MNKLKTMKILAYCIFILFIFNGCFTKNNKFSKVCKKDIKVGEIIEVYGRKMNIDKSEKLILVGKSFVKDMDNCNSIIVRNTEIDNLPMGSIIWAKGIVKLQKIVGYKGGQLPEWPQYIKYLEVKEFKLIKMGTGEY